MAGLGAFAYRRNLTVTTTSGGANIASSLTDFPVCIVVNSSSWSNATERGHFFDASNTAGKRVQFYSGATSLAYEVEAYDSGGQSAVYWVKVPTVTGNSTTVISVGYGNDPNGSAQDSATGVWDSNFLAVHHLVDLTTSTTSDSTSNGLTGTKTGANQPQSATAVIATGQTYVRATSDRIQITPLATPAAISYSIWIKGTNWTPAYTTAVALYEAGATPPYVATILVKSNGKLACYFANKSYDGAGSNTLVTGTWYHLAASYSSSAGLVGYVNGASDGTAIAGNAIGNTTPRTIGFGGHPSVAGRYLQGLLDEARVSTAVRAADWFKGEYWSMKGTTWPGDGWLTIGSEVRAATRSQAVVVA